MAKGNAVFTEVVRDQGVYDGYAQKAVATIKASGGRIIVVDDDVTLLESTWHGKRTVVLEFDSADAARAWYDSAEYQAVIKERHASTEANAVILHGIEG